MAYLMPPKQVHEVSLVVVRLLGVSKFGVPGSSAIIFVVPRHRVVAIHVAPFVAAFVNGEEYVQVFSTFL